MLAAGQRDVLGSVLPDGKPQGLTIIQPTVQPPGFEGPPHLPGSAGAILPGRCEQASNLACSSWIERKTTDTRQREKNRRN